MLVFLPVNIGKEFTQSTDLLLRFEQVYWGGGKMPPPVFLSVPHSNKIAPPTSRALLGFFVVGILIFLLRIIYCSPK